MVDISVDILNRTMKNIGWWVGKFNEKGKATESLETIIGRIRTSTDCGAAPEVEFAIEAVFEKLDVKQEIFRKLDEVCQAATRLVSNTLAIPITELASVTNQPEKVLGFHFFNPLPIMEVVEVIKGIETPEEAMQAGVDFVCKNRMRYRNLIFETNRRDR